MWDSSSGWSHIQCLKVDFFWGSMISPTIEFVNSVYLFVWCLWCRAFDLNFLSSGPPFLHEHIAQLAFITFSLCLQNQAWVCLYAASVNYNPKWLHPYTAHSCDTIPPLVQILPTAVTLFHPLCRSCPQWHYSTPCADLAYQVGIVAPKVLCWVKLLGTLLFQQPA
jgi:hypothetical protein